MAKKEKATDTSGWITRQEMAAMFCVRPEHWDKTYRRHLRPEQINKTTRPIRFRPDSVKTIIDALLDEQKDKTSLDGGDPLLEGGGEGSPALERYRAARAGLAERDLAERDGELVRMSEVEGIVMGAASHIRVAGERLAREFGAEAQDILDECLDEVTRELERTDRSDTAKI